MNKIYKIIILGLSVLIFTGCSTKITVKSLHPSKIEDEKIHTVFVDRFYNDRVNQTALVESELSSAFLKSKKLFKLKTNSFNTDAIIAGEVLESSLNYEIYYKEDFDKKRCLTYEVDKQTKKRTCIKYIKRVTPCEKREYKVQTKIDVLKTDSNELLFSKVYSKTKHEDECFENTTYISSGFHRNKKTINTNLARQIANEFLYDISPHYEYHTIEIVDEIKSIKLSKEQEEEFEKSVELIDDGYITQARKKLQSLNETLDFKSWEILYNLALIEEKFENLKNAQTLYEEAEQNAVENEDLQLIQTALNRVNRNLSEKIKAISQLP